MGMSRKAMDMSMARRGMGAPKPAAAPQPYMGMKKGGMAKSGSSASKRADGVAHKGKTKGKIVKMKYGGKC